MKFIRFCALTLVHPITVDSHRPIREWMSFVLLLGIISFVRVQYIIQTLIHLHFRLILHCFFIFFLLAKWLLRWVQSQIREVWGEEIDLHLHYSHLASTSQVLDVWLFSCCLVARLFIFLLRINASAWCFTFLNSLLRLAPLSSSSLSFFVFGQSIDPIKMRRVECKS